MRREKSWKLRGCVLLALLMASPFLVIGAIVLGGLALGAFTVSLPFLLVLGGIAVVTAALAGATVLIVRMILNRRGAETREELIN